jgi:hypothetical protein
MGHLDNNWQIEDPMRSDRYQEFIVVPNQDTNISIPGRLQSLRSGTFGQSTREGEFGKKSSWKNERLLSFGPKKYVAYQYSRQPAHFLLIPRLPVGHISFLSVLFDAHFCAAALLLWLFDIENFWCHLYGGLLPLSRGMTERDLELVPKEWFVGSRCVRDFQRRSKSAGWSKQ